MTPKQQLPFFDLTRPSHERRWNAVSLGSRSRSRPRSPIRSTTIRCTKVSDLLFGLCGGPHPPRMPPPPHVIPAAVPRNAAECRGLMSLIRRTPFTEHALRVMVLDLLRALGDLFHAIEAFAHWTSPDDDESLELPDLRGGPHQPRMPPPPHLLIGRRRDDDDGFEHHSIPSSSSPSPSLSPSSSPSSSSSSPS